MSRPHIAALVEDAWNSALGVALRASGFRHRIVPHVGYAGTDFVRVFARVLLAPEPGPDAGDPATRDERRGWRNFVTAEALDVEVRIDVAGHEYVARTDRSGNLDVRMPNPGLEPGWAEVRLTAEDAEPAVAQVLVVDPAAEFGIVSDIDDTVIKTWLPRPLVAAYNSFVATEQARIAIPGMALFYGEVLQAHPGAPTFYVSTGAWNTAGTLRRFLRGHGFPAGPMFLTDWGPTNTGWFRSGAEHKRTCLRELAADFPGVSWLLIGDDGQRDPGIYAEFAREHPARVAAIAIRELRADEQVLAHGTPGERRDAEQPDCAEGGAGSGLDAGGVPVVRGPDGVVLADRLRGLI